MRAVAIAAALLVSGQAMAQGARCASSSELHAGLYLKYNERVVAEWMEGDTLVELFVSPEGETVTLLRTKPGKPSCIAGAGRFFQVVPNAPYPEG